MSSHNRIVGILFILWIFLIGQIAIVWSIGEEQRIEREWDSTKTAYMTLTVLSTIAIIAISIIVVRKLRLMKKKNDFGKDHPEKDGNHDSKS